MHDVLGETSAETLFQRGEDLHALERIETQIANCRLERYAFCTVLGDTAYLFQDRVPLFGSRLAP